MRAKQILHFLLGSIPTFLSILQLIVCKPVKQEKIEKSRLKIEAAEKRLKNLNIQRQLRLHSEDNADKNEVEIDHSNRPKWIKKDMVQVKIKADMKRHRLTAKILRDNPEMKEIFDHRSSELRQQFNKLQRQKNKLKRTGLTDRKSIDLNLRDENSQFSKYDDKVTKCRKIIQKHQQNIRNLCSNPKNMNANLLHVCRPVIFKEYHKKQEKIKQKRLKVQAAELRLKAIRGRNHRRIRSENNAEKNGVDFYHSNRSKWVKADIQHVKVEENKNRHNYISKAFRNNNPEISEIFNSKADHIGIESDKLQKKKDKLKETGDSNHEHFTPNLNFELNQYFKYNRKANECRRIIAKNEEYLSTHNTSPCNIL